MFSRVARVTIVIASLVLVMSRTLTTVRAPAATPADVIVSQLQQRRS